MVTRWLLANQAPKVAARSTIHGFVTVMAGKAREMAVSSCGHSCPCDSSAGHEGSHIRLRACDNSVDDLGISTSGMETSERNRPRRWCQVVLYRV